MQYSRRAYQHWQDLQAIAELAYTTSSHFLHTIDLPYRLASWAIDKPGNFQFWHDEAGRLVAAAIVQEAFLALEYLIHHSVKQDILEQEIVQFVSLQTSADNAPAINLYTSLGFRKQYTMLGYRHLFWPQKGTE